MEAQDFVNNHTVFSKYLKSCKTEGELFGKLIISILYVYNKLDYPIDNNEVLKRKMLSLNLKLFADSCINKEFLSKLVLVGISFVCEFQIDEMHKDKYIQKLTELDK